MLWVLGAEKWSLDRLDSFNEPLTPGILGLWGLICQAQISKGLSPLYWFTAWRNRRRRRAGGGSAQGCRGAGGITASRHWPAPSSVSLCRKPGTKHVASVWGRLVTTYPRAWDNCRSPRCGGARSPLPAPLLPSADLGVDLQPWLWARLLRKWTDGWEAGGEVGALCGAEKGRVTWG